MNVLIKEGKGVLSGAICCVIDSSAVNGVAVVALFLQYSTGQ
jgi:hypothetical protein